MARTRWVAALVLTSLAVLGTKRPAYGQEVLVVNDTSDQVDALPGDGVCAAVSGACTLRAAFMEIDGTLRRGSWEVRVPAGHYRLTIPSAPHGVPLPDDGDLYVGGYREVSVVGDGPGLTVVQQTVEDRVLHSDGTLVLRGLTITGGRSTDARRGENRAFPGEGGGIFIGNGTATLINVEVTGNRASVAGGGVSCSVFARTTIRGSTVVENEAGSGGGGIAGGSLDIALTTISGNRGGKGGGGLLVLGPADRVKISDSIVSGNAAGDETLIAEGLPAGYGGGVYGFFNYAPWMLRGPMRIRGTTIRGNIAGAGGGISTYGFDPVSIERSLIAGNTGVVGGGAYLRGPTLFWNTTLSGNAAGRAGAVEFFSSGLSYESRRVEDKLSFRNVTIAANSADYLSSGLFIDDSAGVLPVTVQMVGTILENEPGQPNCDVSDSSAIDSLGSNLEMGTSCGLLDPTDLRGTSALLGPLADNGGPTLTHALLPGSPAVDAYHFSRCPDTDQRGGLRPSGERCDIGAFEQGATVLDPGRRPPTVPGDLRGGDVVLTLSPSMMKEISAAGIRIVAVSPAESNQSALKVPATGGYLGVRWAHAGLRGNIVFERGANSLRARAHLLSFEGSGGKLAFVVGDSASQLTTASLFALEQATWSRKEGQGRLVMTQEGARILNQALGTKLFAPGLVVGDIRLTGR